MGYRYPADIPAHLRAGVADEHRRVATFADGSQVLIVEHIDGSARAMTRPSAQHIWSVCAPLETAP